MRFSVPCYRAARSLLFLPRFGPAQQTKAAEVCGLSAVATTGRAIYPDDNSQITGKAGIIRMRLVRRRLRRAPNSPENLPLKGPSPASPPFAAQLREFSRAAWGRLQSGTRRSHATNGRQMAAVSGAGILTAVDMRRVQPSPSSARWSGQASGRSMPCRARAVRDGGWHPSTMAVTMSGARHARAASLPSRVRQRPCSAAMLAIDWSG